MQRQVEHVSTIRYWFQTLVLRTLLFTLPQLCLMFVSTLSVPLMFILYHPTLHVVRCGSLVVLVLLVVVTAMVGGLPLIYLLMECSLSQVHTTLLQPSIGTIQQHSLFLDRILLHVLLLLLLI